MPVNRESIVIIGGGIVGCSTAYYLSQTAEYINGSLDVTLSEANCVAAAASGYAGGFLARDWHGDETSDLGRLSFKCHQDLASIHDGALKWGYVSTTSMSLTAQESVSDDRSRNIGKGESEWLDGVGGIRTRHGGKKDVDGIVPRKFDWINARHVTGISQMDSATAQINPLKLTRFLAEESERRGVKVIIGTARKVEYSDGRVSAVVLNNGQSVPCDKILLAAGPWTGQLHDGLFPSSPALPISSFAGTSLLLQASNHTLTPYAVFGVMTLSDGEAVEIEFFGREDEQIWIGGVNDYSTLHDAAQGVEPRAVDVDKLTRISALLFPDTKVSRVSKCHRPVNSSNRHGKDVPIMQEIQPGVFVCAGHSVWGISLGPGSGLVMSRMMTGQPLGCDISRLHI